MTIKADLDFECLKPAIGKSLQDELIEENKTPEGETAVECSVLVPRQQIVADADEVGTAYATVIYITYTPNKREHVVRVKFKYDKQGKFKKGTMTYV
jgi:hypothetical protein